MIFNSVNAIFYPKRCIFCGKCGDYICHNCFDKIDIFKTNTCFVCGKIETNCKICPRCTRKSDLKLNSIIVSSHYEGMISKAIDYIKYEGMFSIIPEITEVLARRMLFYNANFSSYTVTSVPLHKKRENIRGFNQSEMIAIQFAKRFSLPYEKLITKVVNTERQVGLSREKRLKNVLGVFECNSKIEQKNIILIDDVVTTGATMNECARQLRNSGAKKVVGLVIARNI